MNLLEFESVIRFVHTENVATNLLDEEIESEYEMYKKWKDTNDVYKCFILLSTSKASIIIKNLRSYFAAKDAKHKPFYTEYHCKKRDIKRILDGQ